MATIDNKDCQRKKTANILRTMILSCSIVLLLLSNMTTADFSSAWTVEDGEAVVQDITPPPEDCEAFFIYHSNNPLPAPYRQVDAYQIADKVEKKTLNGYSGQTPRDWEGLWEIDSEEYLSAVSSWIKQNDLQGVYGYDQTKNQWIAFENIELNPALSNIITEE